MWVDRKVVGKVAWMVVPMVGSMVVTWVVVKVAL